MAIGDLLAEITGEKPAPKPVSSTAPSPHLGKRKAADDVANDRNKVRAVALGSTSSSQPQKTPNGTKPSEQGSSSHTKLSTQHDGPKRPTVPTDKHASGLASNGDGASAPVQRPKTISELKTLIKSSPRPPTGEPPKKGSFREIMERGKLASQKFAGVGKIQHKPLEKVPSKQERMEMKAEMRNGKRQMPAPVAKYTGTARPQSGSGGSSNRETVGKPAAPGRTDGSGQQQGASSKRRGAAEPEPPKKVKKAALATTGYQGTARPSKPPATSSKAANGDDRSGQPRPEATARSVLAGMSSHRRPAGRRSRYDDEYDDEMDDFIEYDEDEEEDDGIPRKRYVEYDGDDYDSSDMEAGMDDIYSEERRTEIIARREDIAEEEAERRHRQEKLERKRRLMAERAKKR